MKQRPSDLKLHKISKLLEIHFEDGSHFKLPCEYLRVLSPSAEVRGHGPGQEQLQIGKENVNIIDIEAVGNYGVKLIFDDGHNTGIYDWNYLYDLSINYEKYWQEYLNSLIQAGYTRTQE